MAERWYCDTASDGDQTEHLDARLPVTMRRVSDWEPFAFGTGTEWNEALIGWRCRVVDVRQYTDDVSDG